jgi:hypothetical protein
MSDNICGFARFLVQAAAAGIVVDVDPSLPQGLRRPPGTESRPSIFT